MDDAAHRELLVQHQTFAGKDPVKSNAMYHDDAILEFPQSGERFFGRDNFVTWRTRYPAAVEFRIRRLTGSGDLWVSEGLISYDGRPPMITLGIHRFRDDKIARESLYVMEPFAPSEARADWVTMFDPLASVAAAEWREGTPFGLDADELAVPAG